jgi:ubiquinone/menaquinone biosynthesis C-methylase UbiE
MATLRPDVPSATVLDLGCGPGVSTFELARHRPDTRFIGVDIAPRMLAEARRRRRGAQLAQADITWIRADAAQLPMRTASVDACTGHSFLYLVHDRAAVLREVHRVTRPGGRLVLMEPNARPTTPGNVLAISNDPRHLVSVTLWRPFSRLHGRFSQQSLSATLEAAGFTDCTVTETLGGLGLLACATRP